ncbi:MAG: hypothetical protein SVV67_06410 [Bacillota bacterium]|nr:hypothetical protein [Bacillota bacterium]
MFVYIHLAAVSPAPDNIEGLIYLKEKYINRSAFLKFHFDMLAYSILLALAVSLFLF